MWRQTPVPFPLTEPLASRALETPNRTLPAVVSLNWDWAGPAAETSSSAIRLIEQARNAAGSEGEAPTLIGRPPHLYLSARLSGAVLEQLCRFAQPGGPIHRVWLDFDLGPQGVSGLAAEVSPALLRQGREALAAGNVDAAHRAFHARGEAIVWAVADSGIASGHPHFQQCKNLDLNGLEPLDHQDLTGGTGPLVDDFGHGTHMAGLIAGESGGMRGAAPEAKLISLKVLDRRGQGRVSTLLAALDRVQEWNQNGRRLRVHGVNLSLGYEFDPSWFACGQSPLCVEVDRLVRGGVVMVAAAGNTGFGRLDAVARATSGGLALTINDPGNAELAITVGSTHRAMPHVYGVSYFSSKGPTGDGRSKPDLVAPGERVVSCDATGGYREDSGTSLAAAFVSGAAAALLSVRPDLVGRPLDVKKLLLQTATTLNRDRTFQGAGLVNLMAALIAG